MLELARDPERVGQVRRTDEQDVDAVDRGNRVGVAERARGLDLDQPDDPLVEPADFGVCDGAETGSTSGSSG